ncbi:MAG: GNAT family N-acetyltransferase [Hyphomicrobiaceae bacterium]|nr:GNAT family N-acetyltransferase [Hyphomicrobiaceae bacterium]
MIPTLMTKRLILRPFREGDLDAVAAFYANEATARFVGGVCSRDDAWRRMASMLGHWTLRGYGPWAIEERRTSLFVGYTGLWKPEGWPEPELIWGLAAGAHGKGYATEAAETARRYAYETIGWRTLASFIRPQNVPSQRVAARLGAVVDGQFELRGFPIDVHRHPGPEKPN